MVRASVASERARRGHKRASALGERAVPKNYPSERLKIANNTSNSYIFYDVIYLYTITLDFSSPLLYNEQRYEKKYTSEILF